MSESSKNAQDFSNFGDLFGRTLKREARPLGTSFLVSPCDGKIVRSGPITKDILIQCKGQEYHLQEFLCDQKSSQLFLEGYYITIYLAPHNYHRVHSPVCGEVKKSIFTPGSLWPVNSQSVNRVPKLFCVNERWTSIFDTEIGKMALTMVGATNVGAISLDKIPKQSTNSKKHPPYGVSKHDPSHNYSKGEAHGVFNMGSTVILLFSKEMALQLSFLEKEHVNALENLADLKGRKC